MPILDGMEATRKITENDLASKVLILTVHEDEEYFREALEAGGSGYVLKKASARELFLAIRTVYREENFIHPSMTKILMKNYLGKAAKDDSPALKEDYEQKSKDSKKEEQILDNYNLLSAREKEVFELVAKGYTNQQIADKLVISVKTVGTHKFRMKKKLKLNKRSELVQLALKKDIL